MGVRGLTTYIKRNQRKFLKTYHLHNCNLILDGYSIATNLYIMSCCESAFGGDYDKFFEFVKSFFKLLSKCMVTPYVIFDGGYEKRKMETVRKRMKDKIICSRNVMPFTHSRSFPLFMRGVFREVVNEMGIKFAQSDFEADDEIAAIARQLNCPVLSYDSDFFIYGVLYIPFPTMCLEACQMTTSTPEDPKYYIECKIYSVENFLSRFCGLNKDMLPLIAALLGNDYIKRSVFKKFYENVNIPCNSRKNHLERRVAVVLNWLKNETFQSALFRVLDRMKKSRRKAVAQQVKRIVRGYTQCSSNLNPYLSIEVDYVNSVEPELNRILDTIEAEGDYPGLDSENNDNGLSGSSDDEDENNEEEEDDEGEEYSESEGVVNVTAAADCIGDDDGIQMNDMHEIDLKELSKEEPDENEIPHWLLHSMREGNIHTCVMDILSLRTYFCLPQVEEYAYPHSHHISLPILSIIAGLLLERSDGLLRYWTRNDKNRLDWFTIEPVTGTNSFKKFPPLGKLPEMTVSMRKQIFMEALGLEKEFVSVPHEWELFIATIVFWLKNMKDPCVSVCHLHTLVMCIVCINMIDSHLGRHRVRRTFTRKHGNFLNKVLVQKELYKVQKKSGVGVLAKVKPDTSDKELSINDCLGNVTKEDCVVIFSSILPYHHISEQLKIKPKLFDKTIVHAFSQFQSCLHLAMVLNSILNFPLEQCFVSKFFSGTFVYNMYTNLSKRSNLGAYIETFFSSVPRILRLYKRIISFIFDSIPDTVFIGTVIKTRRKKKKPKFPLILSSQPVKCENSSEEEYFADENNKFSLLAISATG